MILTLYLSGNVTPEETCPKSHKQDQDNVVPSRQDLTDILGGTDSSLEHVAHVLNFCPWAPLPIATAKKHLKSLVKIYQTSSKAVI